MTIRPLLFAPLLPLLLAVAAPAQNVVLIEPDLDTTIYDDATGTTSNGSGPVLFCGVNGQPFATRTLLRFDVASALPPGAVVVQARLRMVVEAVSGGASALPTDCFVHRMLTPWGEGASSAGGGNGAPAQAGDATWLHSDFPNQLWATPGGDFQPSPSDLFTLPGVGPLTTPPLPGLAVDVNLWLADPSSNHGWVLMTRETVSDARRFTSREGAPGRRPVLDVRYIDGVTTVPGSGCVQPPLPLQAAGDARIGTPLLLTASPSAWTSFVVVGASRVDTPLAGLGCSCTLVPSADLVAFSAYSVQIPNDATLVGAQLFLQGLYIDFLSSPAGPGCAGGGLGFGLGDAVSVTVQP